VSSSTRAEDRRGSVAAVVVNYNDLTASLRCLRSIRDASPETLLVLVDNGSHNDCREAVSAQEPDATVVRLERNLGYAGGCNAGVAAALAGGAEYLLILNNDTTIERETVPALIQHAREHPDAILAPKILFADGSEKVWSAGGRIFGPLLRNEHIGKCDPSSAHTVAKVVPWATGCALFFSAECYRRVGPLDERYFLYLEDVDWCLTASSRGVKTWFVPDALVHHEVSRTLKSSEWADDVRYYAYRNGYRLAFRHGNAGTRPVVIADAVWTLTKAGIRSATSRSHRHDRHYHVRTHAVIDFLKGRWGPYRAVKAPAAAPATTVASR
jgi:GT2 family glycosyltransferase